jgi:hypothetical protein
MSNVSQYTAPSRLESEDHRLGWLKEAEEDGDNYLKSQRSWRDIDAAVDVLSGHISEKIPKGQSQVTLNMVARDIKEMIATLSNMRPIWSYKSDNQDFSGMTEILNKMLFSWYLQTYADRSVREALQWAAAGCGYLGPVWRKDFWCTGRGDIKLKAYGPTAVKPYQIGSDHDLQQAYLVTIVDEVPFAKAMAMYPTQIEKIVTTRSTPTWMRKGIRRVSKFLSPVLQRYGPDSNKKSDISEFPTIDIRRSYILDLSYNDSGKNVTMGTPGTKWEYDVPSYGSEIPTGDVDAQNRPLTVKASLDDSLLYPLRRLCVWTDYGMLYDDSATDWHAKVPIVAFRLDDWPWDYLGGSLVHTGNSVQESNLRLMRSIDDSANARLDPAIQYDESTISQALMDRLKLRVPGQRIKANLQLGEGVKPVLPAAYYDVPQWITSYIDGNWEKLHYVLGTRDVAGLAKAKMMSGDSLEKAVELAGPIVTDMSRNMERSMRDLGEMWKGMALQYYDVQRRVQILGKDGVTEEDFDFDPETMIPSHLPDEFARIKQNRMSKDAPSRATIVKRAKAYVNACYFHITPNSLHQITQITRKLLMLQLWKAGFPVDPWSVADALDLDNFGTPDKVAALLEAAGKTPTDKIGRWIMWKELMAKLAPQQGQPGRKPTGQTPPAVQQKDNGTRSTVRESPR